MGGRGRGGGDTNIFVIYLGGRDFFPAGLFFVLFFCHIFRGVEIFFQRDWGVGVVKMYVHHMKM